ncbi:MAG: hypothetical protein AVDCRST_MAG93-10025, partial [uncultured Chloroflexia bacterium]
NGVGGGNNAMVQERPPSVERKTPPGAAAKTVRSVAHPDETTTAVAANVSLRFIDSHAPCQVAPLSSERFNPAI